MADILITDVNMNPNPVEAGKKFILSVEVRDKIFGIMASDGKVFTTQDGKVIVKNGPVPRYLKTEKGPAILTGNNKFLMTF